MGTMEERWEVFDKRYPDTDHNATRDADAWLSDEKYLRSHINRINMKSQKFGFAITPTQKIYGLNTLIGEVYLSGSLLYRKKDAWKRALRIHDITIRIIKKLAILSEESILEWLDWKGVVYYYSAGYTLHLPRGMFNDSDLTEARDAIEAAERLQPYCPICGGSHVHSETNNLGQTVYRCDSYECSRYVADTDN